MKTSLMILRIALVATVFGSLPAVGGEGGKRPARSSIPYVATRSDTVQDMLWIANVGKDDVVYDLGSGDGRIVIAAVRDGGARRAVGVETNPERVTESRKNARKAGVADRVEFIRGDLFATDFREASVVTLFLGHRNNIKLRSKMLRILKPGTRIVSHQFGMGEWEADKALTVRTVYLGMWGEMWSPFKDNPKVPDYATNEPHFGKSDKIFMWVLPAGVAGIWAGKVETEQGPQDLQLILHQRLSNITGTFQLSGKTDLEGWASAELWGDHLRFWCRPDKAPYGRFELRFDGHVRENTMRGTLAVVEGDKIKEHTWKAGREIEDFAGTWEWSCASGPRSARLRIERREGRLSATYRDGDRTIPVTDFYDFGGGFYFTLLIGRTDDGSSLRITKDTGWLIGEAVAGAGALKGRIEFYPYGEIDDVTGGRKASQPVIEAWAPRRVKP